jgi:arylsulfatase A-like enzyme
MLAARARGAQQALPVALLLAALGLAGCGGLRSSGSSPELPPVAVGEPGVGEVIAGVRSANLVICVLDATRADRVGCHGYPRETTPSIDHLAGESLVFESHFTPIPSTKPATASLFTGLYPDSHGLIGGGVGEGSLFTLAKGFKAAGFRTAFFTSNLIASPEMGVGTDFEQVFGKPSGEEGGRAKQPDRDFWRTPEGLTQAFGRWLAREGESPFFAYCHFLPPHNPYNAPDVHKRFLTEARPAPVRRGRLEFREAAPPYGNIQPYQPREWADLYDANLRWADWGIGEVVRLLRERGLLENTLLVVTSDHGEAFGEHGYIFHSHAVYDEFVHIPLLIRFPGRQRLVGRVAALTQTVDLLPTVCDLYGIDYPGESVQGSSLLPLLDGSGGALRDYAFASSVGPWPTYLVRDAQWSLMLFRGGTLQALYDLQRDPKQTTNLIDEHRDTAARMTAALEEFAGMQGRSLAELLAPRETDDSEPAGPGSKLSDETRRELKALGYLR